MAIEKTKHQFVDDNPYLVYSGEPESTLDNAGGGSGGSSGDAGYVVVTISNPTVGEEGDLTAIADKSKSEVLNAINDGKIAILKFDSNTDFLHTIEFYNLSQAILTNPTNIRFSSTTVRVASENMVISEYKAEYYGNSEYNMLLTETTAQVPSTI